MRENTTAMVEAPLFRFHVDAELPVLRRMFAKRQRAYQSLGYELAETV